MSTRLRTMEKLWKCHFKIQSTSKFDLMQFWPDDNQLTVQGKLESDERRMNDGDGQVQWWQCKMSWNLKNQSSKSFDKKFKKSKNDIKRLIEETKFASDIKLRCKIFLSKLTCRIQTSFQGFFQVFSFWLTSMTSYLASRRMYLASR